MTESILLERLIQEVIKNKEMRAGVKGLLENAQEFDDESYTECFMGWLREPSEAAVELLTEDNFWEVITHAHGDFARHTMQYVEGYRSENEHYSKLEFLQKAATAALMTHLYEMLNVT